LPAVFFFFSFLPSDPKKTQSLIKDAQKQDKEIKNKAMRLLDSHLGALLKPQLNCMIYCTSTFPNCGVCVKWSWEKGSTERKTMEE
jgi:hypothetical protein